MAASLEILIKAMAVFLCLVSVAGSWGSMDMVMEEGSNIQIGQTIHLECSWGHDDDHGDNDTPEVKWYFNNALINFMNGTLTKYRVTNYEYKSSLQIRNINREDQGTYKCLVTFQGFVDTGSYELDFHLPPEIAILPTNMPQIGAHTMVVCKTVGKQNSNIKWGAQTYQEKMDSRRYLDAFPRTEKENISNKTGTFLILHLYPVVDQTGGYFCHTEDKHTYTNLTVKGISIDCEPKQASVMPGGKASFVCIIKSLAYIGDGIRWKKKTPTGIPEDILPTNDQKYFIHTDFTKSRTARTHFEIHDVNIRDTELVYILHVRSSSMVPFYNSWEAQASVTMSLGGIVDPEESGGDSDEMDDFKGSQEGDPSNNKRQDDKVVVVNHTSVAAIVGATMGALAVIIVVFVAFICYKKRRKAKKNKSRLDPNYLYQYEYHGEANTHTANPTFMNPGYQMPPPKQSLRKENTYVSTIERERLEFPRDKLQLGVDLGEGRFGKVIQGRAMNITGTGNWIQVAVKTCRATATDSEKQDLYQELEIMRKVPSHPNVVALYGCCSKKDPLYIIMEYVQRGSMLSYLRKCRPASRMSRDSVDSIISESTMSSSFMQPRAKDLTIFALQIARGMAHVANIGIIHRDLAARNILLATDFTCKICDFGLARDVEGVDVYERTSKGPLPIRWMAPESLEQNMYMKKSDVWSYGVLIWEIVTLGATPYQGKSAMEVMRQVLQGYCLPQPLHCREEMYELMLKCWEKPEHRPSFSEIVTHFEALMDDDYIILSEYDENDYQWLDSYTMEERV